MAHGKAWMVRQKRCWPACFACAEAYRRSIKKEVWRRAAGHVESSVHAGKSALLVREMIDKYGRRQNWISKESGVSLPTIKRLYTRMPGTVYPRTERRLMKLHEKVVAAGKVNGGLKKNWRPADLSILAVKGLMAQGYSQPWIAEQIGTGQRPISTLVTGRQQFVTHEREAALIELARRVGSSYGGSTKSRRKAERNGWKATMYYDELV